MISTGNVYTSIRRLEYIMELFSKWGVTEKKNKNSQLFEVYFKRIGHMLEPQGNKIWCIISFYPVSNRAGEHFKSAH